LLLGSVGFAIINLPLKSAINRLPSRQNCGVNSLYFQGKRSVQNRHFNDNIKSGAAKNHGT